MSLDKIDTTPDSPELKKILQETHKETQSLKAQIMLQNILEPFKIGKKSLDYQKLRVYILSMSDRERGNLKNNISKLYRLLNDRFQSTKDIKEKSDILAVAQPIFSLTGGISSEQMKGTDAEQYIKDLSILKGFNENLVPDRSAIYSAITTVK